MSDSRFVSASVAALSVTFWLAAMVLRDGSVSADPRTREIASLILAALVILFVLVSLADRYGFRSAPVAAVTAFVAFSVVGGPFSPAVVSALAAALSAAISAAMSTYERTRGVRSAPY